MKYSFSFFHVGPLSLAVQMLLVLILALILPCSALAELVQQLDRPGGLAVLSGKESIRQALEIAPSGRWLLHIVVDDPQEEERIREQTQRFASIISVSQMTDRAPFSSDTVNATLLSKGASFPEEEALRITAPGGTLWVLGKTSTVPRKEAYGDWTHWRADVNGTGIVEDSAVGPSNRLGWMSQGMFASNMRTIHGVVASDFTVWGKSAETLDQGRMPKEQQRLVGRDAFSGVRLWQHGHTPENTWHMRETFAAHPSGFIHLNTEKGAYMVRTDPFSGEVTMVYDQGLRAGQEVLKRDRVMMAHQRTGSILIQGDILIQALNKEVVILNVLSGDRILHVTVEDYIARAAVSPDRNTLFVQEIPKDKQKFGPRWAPAQTSAISAYDLNSGERLWRHPFEKQMSPAFAKRRYSVKHPQYPNLTAMVVLGDALYAYDQEANLGGDGAADLYAFDTKSGKLRFHHPGINFVDHTAEKRKSIYSNNMVIWNGEMYHRAAKLPKTVNENMEWGAVTSQMGNTRCVRLSGSSNYLFFGFNSYLSKDGEWTLSGLSRGNCAMPNYAAYGALLAPGDQQCSCYNGLRGHTAFLPPARAPFQVLPEAERLSHPNAPRFQAHEEIPSETLKEDMFQVHHLRYVWEQRKQSMQDGEQRFDIDMQRQAIQSSGPKNWSYRSDARIYYQPSMNQDALFVSSTAGTLTAVDRNTGQILWRFLAAPGYEKAVVNGQIESRWPAVNSILKDGTLYVAAGRHAELDGGIWLWALNPEDGSVLHRARIFLPMTRFRQEEIPSGPRSPHRFRSNRTVASKSLLMSGLGLTETGEVAIKRARWNKRGSSASNAGYWSGMEVNGERKQGSSATPDSNQALYTLLPIKLAEWDGRVLDPLEAFQQDMDGSPYDRDFIWRGVAAQDEAPSNANGN